MIVFAIREWSQSDMASAPVRCGRCETTLPTTFYNRDALSECPGCSAKVQAHVFPAYYRATTPIEREGLSDANEATCFYHPQNRAMVACDSCGRFLCSVCNVDLGGETLCPGCVHSGIRNRKLTRLENRRILYDNVALTLATAPLLMIWPTLLTAPMAIWVAVRYWRTPSSLVPRNKLRLILAISFALIQVGVWGFIAYAFAVSRGLA
jgi:hypothetical protein